MSYFPFSRPRRLRQNGSIRSLVQEYSVTDKDLIQPFFILEGEGKKEAIVSMPTQYRYSLDLLLGQVQKCYDLGIKAIALFPATPEILKCDQGIEALNPDNLMCKAIKSIKKNIPDILIMADVALDPYTSHGQDGVIDAKGIMKNDETLSILVQQSLLQAEAGADIIAPSDMCDGRIGKIREVLENNSFPNTLLASYAVKYASQLYAPFREAVGSSSSLKLDKKNYQMDYHNATEALREVSLDIQEGADLLIVKPALFYLDIIYRVKQSVNIPLVAYQVSGEYSMLSAYMGEDVSIRKSIIEESLVALKRAGCDSIITYFAMEYVSYLKS